MLFAEVVAQVAGIQKARKPFGSAQQVENEVVTDSVRCFSVTSWQLRAMVLAEAAANISMATTPCAKLAVRLTCAKHVATYVATREAMAISASQAATVIVVVVSCAATSFESALVIMV